MKNILGLIGILGIASAIWLVIYDIDKTSRSSQKPETTNIRSVIPKSFQSEPIQTAEDSRFHNYDIEYIGCRDVSLGKVNTNSTNQIFQWTDDNGVVHFSDTPPENNEQPVKVQNYENPLDYFDLTITGFSNVDGFRNRLEKRIQHLFKFYGHILHKESLRKIDSKIQLFASEQQYQQHRLRFAKTVSANSNGYYSHATNQSYILVKDAKRTLVIAVHETTHAINKGVLGVTSRWLNEGLAEYLEQIDGGYQYIQIKPNSSWYRNGRINFKPINLSTLFSANYEAWNRNQTDYYGTSWAFISFLMDSDWGRGKLSELIRLEQLDPCSRLTPVQILNSVFDANINTLDQQFNQWLRSRKVKTYQI